MEYLKKNWLVILVGCLSTVLGVLTLLTVAKLRKTTPVAPTVPQKKPQAVIEACTLTFRLTVTVTPTGEITPTPTGETIPISSTSTGETTPTPTGRISPTATPSATPTFTPTVTPTSKPNDLPICTGLSANSTSGKAPLEVTFTGNGVDPDGKITAFEFTFGDGEVKTVEKDAERSASHSLDHTYSSSGAYWASLRVKDNNAVWSDIPESCKVKIEVIGLKASGVGGEGKISTSGGITKTPTPTVAKISKIPSATSSPIPVPEVPEAGIALPTVLTILSGSFLILLGILL